MYCQHNRKWRDYSAMRQTRRDYIFIARRRVWTKVNTPEALVDLNVRKYLRD